MFPPLFFVNKIEGNGEAGSRSVQNRLQESLDEYVKRFFLCGNSEVNKLTI